MHTLKQAAFLLRDPRPDKSAAFEELAGALERLDTEITALRIIGYLAAGKLAVTPQDVEHHARANSLLNEGAQKERRVREIMRYATSILGGEIRGRSK
jgi:hypothetical protein